MLGKCPTAHVFAKAWPTITTMMEAEVHNLVSTSPWLQPPTCKAEHPPEGPASSWELYGRSSLANSMGGNWHKRFAWWLLLLLPTSLANEIYPRSLNHHRCLRLVTLASGSGETLLPKAWALAAAPLHSSLPKVGAMAAVDSPWRVGIKVFSTYLAWNGTSMSLWWAWHSLRSVQPSVTLCHSVT